MRLDYESFRINTISSLFLFIIIRYLGFVHVYLGSAVTACSSCHLVLSLWFSFCGWGCLNSCSLIYDHSRLSLWLSEDTTIFHEFTFSFFTGLFSASLCRFLKARRLLTRSTINHTTSFLFLINVSLRIAMFCYFPSITIDTTWESPRININKKNSGTNKF